MSDAPEVRYASSGEVEIAYEVLGDGPVDVVWVAGSITHLGVLWEHPATGTSASSWRRSHG